jgi:hypothetical protein
LQFSPKLETTSNEKCLQQKLFQFILSLSSHFRRKIQNFDPISSRDYQSFFG